MSHAGQMMQTLAALDTLAAARQLAAQMLKPAIHSGPALRHLAQSWLRTVYVCIPHCQAPKWSADTRHWFTLRRRDATDNVSGRLQLEFAWDVTARSLLSLKLSALENVLCQRTEILCALNPVPASKAYKWIQKAPDSPKSAHPVSIQWPCLH